MPRSRARGVAQHEAVEELVLGPQPVDAVRAEHEPVDEHVFGAFDDRTVERGAVDGAQPRVDQGELVGGGVAIVGAHRGPLEVIDQAALRGAQRAARKTHARGPHDDAVAAVVLEADADEARPGRGDRQERARIEPQT
jgi:hypothetical protein